MKDGIKRAITIPTLGLALTAPSVMAQEQVSLFAANSLQAALTEVTADFNKANPLDIKTKFSSSDLLGKAIAGGEQADVFVSANMEAPKKLEAQGWGGPAVMFARNKLCALAQPDVKTSTDTLIDTMLDDNVRVGSFASKADSSADYVWEMFAKSEIVKSGSFNVLSRKALTLTADEESQKTPKALNQYALAMDEKKTDLLLTYCTNALLAKKDLPSLQVIHIQPEMLVGGDYGLLVRKDAPENAWKLAKYLLSPEGQKTLNSYGFVTIPSDKK